MSESQGPRAEVQGVIPILRVTDVQASITYFTDTLGFEKLWDYGDFANVRHDKSEIFLALNQGTRGSWICVMVSNVNALHDEIVPRGAKIAMPLTDMEHGMRELWVEDLDGNVLRFGHVLHPKNFKVTRTNVDVRLEERMAAVLRDLAAATNRTVGEVLEETLLHTFYNVGPHLDSTLKLIEQLRQKHHLDYDVHANYNFTES